MRTLSSEQAKLMRAKGKGSLGFVDPTKAPTRHPTIQDIAWAAGIFEGEGCPFASNSSQFASVVQKQEWLPTQLQSLFGGSINITQRKEAWRGDGKPSTYFQWQVSGTRARGFLMTIFSFMSPRRKEQIKWVLGHQTKEQYLANSA